jgi:pilus assembly protein CpaC
VRRLAEPNLTALSGDTASFLAGGEFPIPVSSTLGTIGIEFKKYGVGLAFTPTVLGDGVINLKIEPEVSEIDPTTSIVLNGITIPALIVRRANTTVELRDGQSFAIAGLLQSINTTNQQQLPWIADVPILGALARSAAFQKKETDLVIIVTPRLVRPARPGDVLRTPLDGTKPGNDADLFLLGQAEVTVPMDRRLKGRSDGSAPPIGHILDVPKGVSYVAK